MKQNISQEEISDLINKDILDIIGLSKLDDAKKDELRTKIIATVENRVLRRITDELQKKKVFDNYEKLVAEDKSVDEFLSENGILPERIFAEEAIIYKSMLKVASDSINNDQSK